VDSTGDTIDFLLSLKRDEDAAKRFFQKALRSQNHPRPRVINVDKNPAYPKAVEDMKQARELGQRCRCRPIRYLNNVVEQGHRAIKRRVRAMQGFRSFDCAWRTIQGAEAVNMIRKGQIRWLPKNDILRHSAIHSRSVRSLNRCLTIPASALLLSSVPISQHFPPCLLRAVLIL